MDPGGELKVHPKFIYRYYVVLLGDLKCALYGSDHSREPGQLAGIKLPDFVRVRGVLGTEHHDGGTKENPSPFPPGVDGVHGCSRGRGAEVRPRPQTATRAEALR